MNTPTRVNSELVAPWAPLRSKNPTSVCLSSINLSEEINSADDMEELIRRFNAMSLEDDTMDELIRNFESMSLDDDMDDIISRFNGMSIDGDMEQIEEEDYYYMDVVQNDYYQDDYYQEHYTLPEDQLYGIENICKYECEQPHANVTVIRGNRPSTQEDYEEDEYFICLKDDYKSI